MSSPATSTPSDPPLDRDALISVDDARPYIGGQAVLEGVMMRSPASFAVAVRRADGTIAIRERPVSLGPSKWSKIPLARGVATLVSSLRMGSEALRFSAEVMEEDLARAEAGEAASNGSSNGSSKVASKVSNALLAFGIALAGLVSRADGEPSAAVVVEEKRGINPMALMTIVAVAFLVALPQLLAWGASSLLGLDLPPESARFQMLTGGFKLFVVLGYLLLIRRVPDIRRVFQYHGAEHKTISTYEAREPLVVENARAKTTLHPRCGTTFLVMTVFVSILTWVLVGALIAPTMAHISTSGWVRQLVLFAVKIPFLPLLAGLTFELQRVTARYCTTGPLRALLWPGFLVQKITTIEPDDDQLEIALASLRATLWREQVGTEAAPPASAKEVLAFPSYAAICEAKGLRAA